jgi:hypothetical protein
MGEVTSGRAALIGGGMGGAAYIPPLLYQGEKAQFGEPAAPAPAAEPVPANPPVAQPVTTHALGTPEAQAGAVQEEAKRRLGSTASAPVSAATGRAMLNQAGLGFLGALNEKGKPAQVDVMALLDRAGTLHDSRLAPGAPLTQALQAVIQQDYPGAHEPNLSRPFNWGGIPGLKHIMGRLHGYGASPEA